MKKRKVYLKRILRWLFRVNHCYGYGIHSPFAYNFVMDVVYNPGHFYSYSQLKKKYNEKYKGILRLKDLLLLFRLANFIRPTVCNIDGIPSNSIIVEAIRAGSMHTNFAPSIINKSASLTLSNNWERKNVEEIMGKLPPDGFLFLFGIGNSSSHRQKWKQITKHKNSRITFDLGDFGIIINKLQLTPHNYIISYF